MQISVAAYVSGYVEIDPLHPEMTCIFLTLLYSSVFCLVLFHSKELHGGDSQKIIFKYLLLPLASPE